ncbi:MAG: hypothetical protein KDC98_25245 [Planctomycetes bacterium]|nr:hypothetical protein [Planctomycetota bacterium]
MRLTTLSALSLLPLFAISATAQAYVIDQPQGNDTFGARSTGQTFTPGVGVTPTPGPGNPILFLTEMDLYHGNYASALPSATTWLKIYDGDPQNGGNFVGISSNTVDTTGLTFRTLMHWDFAQLPLLTTTEYWAVMSSTSSPATIDVAEVSLETAPRGLVPPGAYAGGAGLIANIVKHTNDVDARFTARFFNGVIGSFTVSGTGCPSSVGQASLSSANTPRIGQTFQADFANLAPTGLPFAVFGLSDTTWNSLPLPLPLASLIPGTPAACMVMVSPDAVQLMALSGTSASVTMSLPNSPSLPGLLLYLQGAQLEGASVSVTAKGTMLVGN